MIRLPHGTAFALCAWAASSPARAGELVTMQVQSTSPVVYETPAPVTTEVNAFALEFGLPIQIAAGTYLLPGASYRLEAPRFVEPPADALPVPRLHEVDVSLALLQSVGERWTLMGQLAGGLAGDLIAVDRDVVRLSGFVLAKREMSETVRFGLGAAATWAFGQLLPLPLVALDWHPSDRFALVALLPATTTATWRPADRLRLGGFAEIVGNEYAIRLPQIAGGPDCTGPTRNPAECVDHLAYTDGNGGAFVGARLAGELWLDLRGGVSVYRRFEMLNADDEPVSFGEQRLPPAPFVKARLTYEY
ncbi:MAG: DUF6268 family outer membrane beta-barrel protein [Myxococcota bacterium]